MELWIRTQDKTTLIRSYEIYIVEHSKSYVIRAKRTSHILGAYKTIERALEVLDEIHERIAILTTMDLMGMDEENAKVFSKHLKEKSCSVVYQMPEE